MTVLSQRSETALAPVRGVAAARCTAGGRRDPKGRRAECQCPDGYGAARS